MQHDPVVGYKVTSFPAILYISDEVFKLFLMYSIFYQSSPIISRS